jgi:phage host-nuclease inhibitor protein Gam
MNRVNPIQADGEVQRPAEEPTIVPVEQIEPEEFGVASDFQVQDDDSANWVIWKIVAARLRAQRAAEYGQREQNRAQREEAFFLFRYGPQLRDYARQKLQEQGGKAKSVHLPAGTLAFRKQPPKLVVEDEAAVIAWARKNQPELVTILESLSKSGLNEYVKQTGDLPDRGVRLEPEKESFSVK